MAKLFGAQRLVLQAIQDSQGETSAFIEDSRVAQATQIALRDMRDWFLTLDQDGYVDLARTEGGMMASVTPQGRLYLGLYQPFPSQSATTTSLLTSKTQSRTGGERALIIGISDYSSPMRKLPAVANDVREMAKLLSSNQSQIPAKNVEILADGNATKKAILEAVGVTFSNVQVGDTVLAYIAGAGAVIAGKYYFVAHDTTIENISSTGIPLSDVKEVFDASPSQRAFLWLDFCHSGGIIGHDFGDSLDDAEVIKTTLKGGHGKLIFASCKPNQYAFESAESGHGLFTDALLRGLKGEAAIKDEVTANTLFDFIDRVMGTERQQPMMFGQMTGRVVLMHLA